MIGRVVRGITALVALLVLCAGTPVALVVAVGSPWPGQSAIALGDLERVTIAVLAAATWLVWARFAIAVVLEVVEQVQHVQRGGGGRGWAAAATKVPPPVSASASGLLAHQLVAALLVVLPLARPVAAEGPRGLPERPPAAVVAEAVDVGSMTTIAHRTPVPVPSPVEVVAQRGDTLVGLAARHLGEVGRWREIFELNKEITQPDGMRLVSPSALRAGWTLRLPADAAEIAGRKDVGDGNDAARGADPHVIVEPGDTLFDLIDEHSSGPVMPDQVSAVARCNDGTATPDGTFVFDSANPDLIHPGQEFVIASQCPPPTAGDGRQDDDASPTERTDRRVRGTEQPTPPVDARTAPITDPATSLPPAPRTAPTRHAPPPSPATTAPGPSTAPAAPVPADAGTDTDRPATPNIPAPIGLGAVALATGLVTMLEVARRRRLRTTQVRKRLAPPAASTVAVERRLRTMGEPERLLRVDVAVRAVATALLSTAHRIAAVLAGPSGDITVITTGAVEVGEPWLCSEPTATRWVLPGEIDVIAIADSARGVGAPCAAFMPIGVTPGGSDVFVDLEAAGTLRIDASGDAAAAVITGIAGALASSIFAESVHLIGVGVERGSFLAHSNQHIVDSLRMARDLAVDLVGTVRVSADSTFALRARHTSGENWEPAVILAGAADDEDVAAWRPRAGIVLVTVGDQPLDGWTLRPADEWWVLEPLALELTPLGVTAEELLALDELITWESAIAEDGDAAAPAAVESGRNGSPLAAAHLYATSPLSSQAASVDEPEPVWDLMVRVFGLVDVVDAGQQPASFSKSKSLELLAWLATHRDQATRAGARAALWEIDVRDATFANVVSEARRALASLVDPPAGSDWIARTLTSSLPLHPRVITDAELVELRFEQARRSEGDFARAALRSAVELIRGMPFAEAGYLWPDAEGITSRLVVLATSCAAALAESELAAGNLDRVFDATGVGLRVLPGHEELIGLRMRAHAVRGDLAGVRLEWEMYERVLVSDPWSDGEPAPKLRELRQHLLTGYGDQVIAAGEGAGSEAASSRRVHQT